MTDNTVAARVRKYAKRQAKRDLVRVTLYVPAEARQMIVDFAEKLRKMKKEAK